MKTLDVVRLKFTSQAHDFIKERMKQYGSTPDNPNIIVVFIIPGTYMLIDTTTVYSTHTIRSPKHQPLVPFNVFEVLLIMPTGEARLEYAKHKIRRKWD